MEGMEGKGGKDARLLDPVEAGIAPCCGGTEENVVEALAKAAGRDVTDVAG